MNLKLLIVENSLPVLRFMKVVLEEQGAEVCAIHESRQAAFLIEEQNFDAIFADLRMPGVDGLELTRRARRSRPNARTPVVILSGRTDSRVMSEAFEAGATFVIYKPLDKARLTRAFSSAKGAMLLVRQSVRPVALDVPVFCQSGWLKVAGLGVSLGLDELTVLPDQYLQPQAVIKASFTLPGESERVNVEGRVTRIDESRRTTIRFTDQPPAERERIRKFLTAGKPTPSGRRM